MTLDAIYQSGIIFPDWYIAECSGIQIPFAKLVKIDQILSMRLNNQDFSFANGIL